MKSYYGLVKQISDILAAEGFPLKQGNLVARVVNLVRERNALRKEVAQLREQIKDIKERQL